MRSRRPTPEHQQAVSQRLALLSEQLAASRDEPVLLDEPEPVAVPTAVGDEWWGEHTRVALRPALRVVPAQSPQPPVPPVPPGAPAPSAVEPVLVPTPGRHADRRDVGWAAVLPETLRGRVQLGPGPLAVVAVVVALALAWTCWQVVRDDPPAAVPVAAPAAGAVGDLVPVAPASAPSTSSTVAPAAGEPSAAATVTVDVAGRVRQPGIVVLAAGSRVVDALEEAGGARPAVDLTTLNLARPLVDGEQILVGVPGASAPPPAAPGSVSPEAGGTAPAALVDLNLADQVQLESLPEVGPVTAAAIVAWREQHGGFSAVTELLEVDGIGEATLATLTPLVTV